MEEVSLKVTVEEANLILEGLGQMPFAKVFALVGKIQEQARQQFNGEDPPGEKADTEDLAPSIGD